MTVLLIIIAGGIIYSAWNIGCIIAYRRDRNE